MMELQNTNHFLLISPDSQPIRAMLLANSIMPFSFRQVMELHKTNHLLLVITDSRLVRGMVLLRTVMPGH
jgi:hypothetical protein